MARNTKAKNDSNGQPAKGKGSNPNSESAQALALNARIDTFGKNVVSVRGEAQQLLWDTGWFAMQFANLKPMTKLIKKAVGMDRKGMIALASAAFSVKAEKDKDTKEERIVADTGFNARRAEFAADKIAFTKQVRALGNYWTYSPDRAFEGLDYIKLILSAGRKVNKAAQDPSKADKVKHAELVGKVEAFLKTLETTDDDDDGGDESDPENTMPIGGQSDGAPEGATLQ